MPVEASPKPPPGKVVAFETEEEASRTGALVISSFRAGYKDKWPVIEFRPSEHWKGQQYKRVLIARMDTEIDNANQGMEALRIQVPLILAWVSRLQVMWTSVGTDLRQAITIHKSQCRAESTSKALTGYRPRSNDREVEG